MKVPLVNVGIGKEEEENVLSVLRSGMLAHGPWVKRFEAEFARYCTAGHAVAVSNGTAALDLALKAIGIGPGDEVIVPDFTFIATANSVLFQGAKPVFADIEPRYYTIFPEEIEKKITERTKAVIAVHLFGQPADIDKLTAICKKHNLALIEDCAQAHGAEYHGKRVGSFGIGAFSFYPTKNMTTGEGGMVTTNDPGIAKKIDLLRNHGQSEKYLHSGIGYNLRMTDIGGAIGVAQLEKLDSMNAKRMENAHYLTKGLSGIPGLKTPAVREGAKHVYHQYVVAVGPEFPLSREEFMKHLHEKEIGCAIHYPMAIQSQPYYASLGYSPDCPQTLSAAKQVLSLPVHPALSKEQLDYVIETIRKMGE